MKECEYCYGEGVLYPSGEECAECDGTGFADGIKRVTCERCCALIEYESAHISPDTDGNRVVCEPCNNELESFDACRDWIASNFVAGKGRWAGVKPKEVERT